MKYRPIPFTGEMVKAILEGRKTQTRRVPKYQPLSWAQRFAPGPFKGYGRIGDWIQMTADEDRQAGFLRCPYGVAGDRLWAKETWAHDDSFCKNIRCGNRDHIWYRASEHPMVADCFAGDARWRSSRFMPRWASRITLEIVNMRVERVKDIRMKDVLAEGPPIPVIEGKWIGYQLATKPFPLSHYNPNFNPNGWGESEYLRAYFGHLWDSINYKRGYGWDVNPWVWVIEFRRVEMAAVPILDEGGA